MGADAVHDYRNRNWAREVGKFDVVLDPIGGLVEELSGTLVAPNGVLVSLVGSVLSSLDERGMLLGMGAAAQEYVRKRHAFQEQNVRYEWALMRPDGEALAELGGMVSAGTLKPHIGKTFSLDEIHSAVEELQGPDEGPGSRSPGKVVLELED